MIRKSDVFTGRRFCLFLLFLFSFCTAAPATTLSGSFKNPDGSFVNGKIIFLLSQPARLNDQSAQIVPMVKIFSITNGALETGAFIYGNDVLVPGGTYYLVRLVDTNNNLLFEQKWSISGVSLDLGTLTPTTTGVVYPDPLIKNLATGQDVQGPVSFSAPLTAFSLTLNGNLNPGAADLYGLGNSSAPWKELHAQRWNSLFAVGSSGGMASAPSTQPGFLVTLSGGSIADGTYYFKTTNWTVPGETTGSPTRTLTVSGGGGMAKIYIGNADFFYLTGAPGFRVYCSNDNVNFYRQTPNPVLADFMIDTFTHYNSMGDAGARLTSLSCGSGTPIPTVNTATISRLQVEVNKARRAPTGTSAPVPFGTVKVPAIDGTVDPSGQFSLQTPLVLMKGDDLRGSGSQAGAVNYQTRIFDDNTWNNTKLGVVMVFGADAHIANLGIMSQSAGAALMILGGAPYQGGTSGPMTVKDVALRNLKTTTGYAPYIGVGILFDMFFHDVSFAGGFYDIEYRNVVGGGHSFVRGRWDANEGFIRNVVGPTNPDDGINNPGFANSLARVFVMGVRTEAGSGILWDVMNLDLTIEDIEVADATIRVGTPAVLKMGRDATYGAAAGQRLKLINASPGSGTNAATGVLNGGATSIAINLVGNSTPGLGSSTGVNVGVNANNQELLVTGMVSATNTFTLNPNPVNTNSLRAINVSNNSHSFYFGGGHQLNGEPTWNEIADRLVFVPNAGNNLWNRAGRATFFNHNDGSFKILASDDSTVRFTFQHSGANAGLLSLTSLRVGTNPAQVGGSSGDIGIRNSGGLWWRNAANSADLLGLYLNSSDVLVVNQPASIGGGPAITKVISATATLDFSNTLASTCSDMTLTVTDAAVGDSVFLGAPSASVPAGGSFSAWVSAANTVTVRFCADGTAHDPASGIFRATIVKF